MDNKLTKFKILNGDYQNEESYCPPFELNSVIGFNPKLGARCLKSHLGENLILYSMGHLASIIDLKSKKSKNMLGHEHHLIALEHDANGRFVVTADIEVCTIWDLKCVNTDQPIALRVIRKPFGEYIKIRTATISPCGKYLIIISQNQTDTELEEGCTLQFWRWSFGKEDCDEKFFLDISYGDVQNICFSQNPGEENFFAVTMIHMVIFGSWNKKSDQMDIHIPETKKFKYIKQSCYIPNSRQVASVTDRGQILIWNDVIIVDHSTKPITNKKNFIKSIPIKTSQVNDFKAIDDYIFTVDDSGDIRFYDKDIKLMFACTFWELPSIQHCSPMLQKHNYKLVDIDYSGPEDETNVQIIYKSTCPVDFSLESKPFIIRDFIITTTNGDIISCSVVRKRMDYILYHSEEVVVAIENHPNQPWILICNSAGRIQCYDYNERTILSKCILEPQNGEQKLLNSIMSCVKISDDALYLAVGFENGFLYMLNPVTLQPEQDKPLHYSNSAIKKIEFSVDLKFCSYTDANNTVVMLVKDNTSWNFIGKYRYHCKPIVSVFFTRFNDDLNLITIGQDRLFVEYDIQESLAKNCIVLKRDLRLEQSAQITAAKLLPSSILRKDTSTCKQIIVTADDHHKFKIYDAFSMENLFTFVGPIFESPISEILFFPQTKDCEDSFLVVGSEKTLGMIINPVDGNPFRYSGVIVHPKKIKCVRCTNDFSNIVVLGDSDTGITCWDIRKVNAKKYYQSGGEGLTPFLSGIPGGKDGWLFKEMIDFFYYIQILAKGMSPREIKPITDNIPICDLIDFMRAIGYFPSEFEQKNILNEAIRTIATKEGKEDKSPATEISFDDVIKIYLNHKPVKDFKLDDIKRALTFFATIGDIVDETESIGSFESYESEQNVPIISREKLLEILTEKGEYVSSSQAMKYLVELLLVDDEGSSSDNLILEDSEKEIQDRFFQLPEQFDVTTFCRDVLGLNVYSSEQNHLYAIQEALLIHNLPARQVDSQVDILDHNEILVDRDEEEN